MLSCWIYKDGNIKFFIKFLGNIQPFMGYSFLPRYVYHVSFNLLIEIVA